MKLLSHRYTSYWLIAAWAVIGLLAATGLPAVAFAASEAKGDTSSLTLTPSSKRFTIDAGKQLSDKLTVLNSGSTELVFSVYARPYSVTGEQYTPSYDGSLPGSDAYKWISFTKTSWQLAPGKTVDIPFSLSVPAGASPGGHYGVIFVETKAPSGSGQAIVRNKRLGSIMRVTVNGNYRTGGNYLGSASSFYQPRPPIEATVRVRNTGNTDFNADIKMTATDLFGRVKYSGANSFVVYPETTRAMPVSWQGSPAFGIFKLKLETKFLDQRQVNESLVLVAPRWMLAVLVVLLAGAVVYALRRRR